MRERVQATLESVVIIAIILVLVQTFLEDFATLVGWTWTARRVLVFAGFFFDLFFTIEFFIRFYTAVYQGQGAEYFLKKRGWIDFVASIPLLLFSSGPSLLSVLAGGTMALAVGSILNVLKVVKAIRIARILRLLRVLKIFKQIKYTDSVMAQRHVATITSMSVTLFVFTLFIASIVSGIIGIPSVDDVVASRHEDATDAVVLIASEGAPTASAIGRIVDRNKDLLVVKEGGATVFTRYSNEFYASHFGPGDYRYIERNGIELFFDNTTINEIQARDNLLYFIIIVLLVVLLLVYYSPHFALTVTDPIHVMRRGMEDASYNFEVKIPERYREDDIYRLAEAYNSVYLPLKDRTRSQEEAKSSLLDFDDVKSIFDNEK